jgi:predicted NUDIX family phosphoesterase
MLSLGVGGHVNPADFEAALDALAGLPGGGAALHGEALAAAVEQALVREVREELHVEAALSLRLAGVLNDDANAVGQVHFGVVYVLEADAPRVRVREREALAGGFRDAGALTARRGDMETWSRILFDHFWPGP